MNVSIDGVNDKEEHARELAKLLKGKNAHVNLIPVNPGPENHFREARETDIRRFQKILSDAGITATRRREMGRDIQGRILLPAGRRNNQVSEGKCGISAVNRSKSR